MVKLTGSKSWIKADDVKDGQVVTFVNEGEWTESSKFTHDDGSPVRQFTIKVKLNGEERDMNLNKVSRENLVEAYGDDTANWVGMSAKVEKVKVMVGGEMKNSIILHGVSKVETPKVKTEDEIPF